ncbi:MAG TPA: baseplate J/gp47 family protein, partial [Flavipsychrobacter sp.]|nr:baseplate J/gp47 family protein [Flavipsychrobacter sp.]
IKSISQPSPSFDGKPVETGDHFYLRVSERLRHKDRAITIWDYERLVLEAFPSIHRVKCVNHTKYIDADYNEIAPGYVTVITIPDLVNRNDANPLRPYTNADVLTQIQDYLQQRISCHINLNVRNPKFEEVRLEFSLKLLPGYEFNYYSNLLKNSITAYLTPWAYGQSDDVQFGGKVEKSSIIYFIEQQSYVDYITDVKMYQRIQEGGPESNDADEIVASTAISILVSAPASKHVINEITDSTIGPQTITCVDTYNNTSRVITENTD